MNPYILLGLVAVGVTFALTSKSRKSILDYNEIFKYKEYVRKYAGMYLTGKISPNWVLAIIAQESAGNPKAVGDNGKSFGLMQIQYAAYLDAGVNYPFNSIKTDPERNIETGVKYLAFVWNYLTAQGVDSTGMLQYTIMSYNIGLGNFLKREKLDAGKAYFSLVENHYKKIISNPGA